MLNRHDALGRVLKHAVSLPSVELPLESAFGLWLADSVHADADQPPFDKALVDGFAVRSEDLTTLPHRLRLGETIFAGRMPTRPLAAGEAATITTGAPLPQGADAVVMLERTTLHHGEVEIHHQPIQAGLNRLPRGRVYRTGDLLVPEGVPLTPARIGLLAAAGTNPVRVVDRARVAVVPTGDELVDFRETPGLGQIRNSNAPMLAALLDSRGTDAWTSPILADDPDALREGLTQALECDVALVIGGVSAGSKDLVPGILQGLGVREVFHKVRLKPGKPLWFGVGPVRPNRPPALVFGLPGNPLSGFVNFHLFVAPALDVLERRAVTGPRIVLAKSARRLEHRSDLETFLPARITSEAPASHPSLTIEPVDWSGSADMASLARADGFLVLPDEPTVVEAGEIVGFLPLD